MILYILISALFLLPLMLVDSGCRLDINDILAAHLAFWLVQNGYTWELVHRLLTVHNVEVGDWSLYLFANDLVIVDGNVKCWCWLINLKFTLLHFSYVICSRYLFLFFQYFNSNDFIFWTLCWLFSLNKAYGQIKFIINNDYNFKLSTL